MADSVFSFRDTEPPQPSGSWENEDGVSFGGPRLGLSRTRPRGLGGNLGGAGVFAQYEGATREEQLGAALSQPLSGVETLTEQARAGVMQSFGLGTAIKDFTIPEGEPTPEQKAGNMLRLLNPLTGGYEVSRRIAQSFMDQGESLSEDAYKSSPYFRDEVPWDAGMTDERAASLAIMHDTRKVREFYARKRPITAFIGNLAGQALDPVNYVPVAGPAVRAAAVAKAGKVAGNAITGSLDAAANTALAGLVTRDRRRSYGDDVSWQTTVSEIATAALIGSAFGTISGALEVRGSPTSRQAIETRLSTLRTTQEARIALNEGIDALVRGEDVALSPNASEPLARIAGRIIREAETVKRAAAISDVAESLRRVAERNPELDSIVSPSEFDRLILADLQARGFDGIQDAAPDGTAGRATPLAFDVNAVEAPRVMKSATQMAINASLRPNTPQAALFRKAEAMARLAELERQEAIANRPHNLAARKLDEWGLPSWDFMRFQTVHMIPDLKVYYADQIKEADTILAGRVPAKVAMNGSRPSPDPLPDGRMEAEARAGKPDDLRAIAEQYQVNPRDGSFLEETDIAQLGLEGRLTDEDRLDLQTAQDDFDNAAAYGEAMKSLANCLI